jgi:hypothetical protein
MDAQRGGKSLIAKAWVRIASSVRTWREKPVESEKQVERARTLEAMRTQGRVVSLPGLAYVLAARFRLRLLK